MIADVDSVRLDPALAEDYLTIARRRGSKVLEATALRTQSMDARDLLAYAASPGNLTADELISQVRTATNSDAGNGTDAPPLDSEWTFRLARVIGLQNLTERDRDDALVLLEELRRQHGPQAFSEVAQKTFAELLWETGQHDVLRERIPVEYPRIKAHTMRYLKADLANPFVPKEHGHYDLTEWQGLVDKIFAEHGIESVTVEGHPDVPFDALTCHVGNAPLKDGPLVSVIVTSYKPGPQLITSVQSICAQTWRNLEIIIIDDASPTQDGEDYDAVLDACAALDPRVRLVRLDRNGGTYRARNAALDVAAGELVTCQDADDWSHPRRIELQAKAMVADSSIPATRSHSIRVTENLVFQRLGYEPTRPNASSLMFRREQALATVGYFDSSRKAADTEYQKRLEIALGARTTDLAIPLAMVRMADGSLSRADFAMGWHHVSRYLYQGAYSRWHRSLREAGGDPYLPREQDERRFAIPQRFEVNQAAISTDPPHYDVVFLSEWRRFGGPQKSMVEEITALKKAGYRVGVAHREAFRFMGGGRDPLSPQILDLINDGTVDFVALDQQASVSLLVIRYPPILQFAPAQPSTLHVGRVVVLANQAPHEVDGTDRRYTTDACDATVRFMFERDPLWIPQGPSVLAMLSDRVPAERLRHRTMPGIIDFDAWYVKRQRFRRSDRPVVGRHSRDSHTKWPATAEELQASYPLDGRYDVRIMGGHKAVQRILGASTPPPGWVSFAWNEVTVRQFLAQLDFYVYFHHPIAVEAFGRAVLEAIATGCVVILPEHFRATFGDAAVYAEPDEVQQIVDALYDDWATYRAQIDRSLDIVREHFSHEAYAVDIAGLLEGVRVA